MKTRMIKWFQKASIGFLLICVMMCILLCSCSTPGLDQQVSITESSVSTSERSENSEKQEMEESQARSEVNDAFEPDIVSSATHAPTMKPTVAPVPDNEEAVAAATPKSTQLPEPKATPTSEPNPAVKVTPSPKPEIPKSESTATPNPTAKPTAEPTAQLTEKPIPTPTPAPVPTAKPTPAVIPTPTPKTERVWVMDMPGHYETVTESKEVWIDEQGHYEEDGYWASDWVYQCNQCGAQYPTVSAVNQHLEDSFDWETMTGHTSYTQVSGPTYWVETDPVWVVDVPGHYETVTESKEVWIEEQGHWETITT